MPGMPGPYRFTSPASSPVQFKITLNVGGA